MFRRTEHRRGRLQADLDSLIYLVERRRAAEGQYVRELREMRFNMKEHELRRAGGNATGLDSMKGVACHLREEADKVRSRPTVEAFCRQGLPTKFLRSLSD